MSDFGDIQAVIDRARSKSAPANWTVWRLRRDQVLRAALGWLFVGVTGLILLALTVRASVPSSFVGKNVHFFFPALVMIILATMSAGGLGLAIRDLWRLWHADEYLLVMTPDDYIKVEPREKLTHVPMESIAYVTLRGVQLPQDRLAVPSQTEHNSLGWLSLRNLPQRQPKSPPSLAFIDQRADKEVVVATDNSFDDLAALEEVLMIYVDAKERQQRENRRRQEQEQREQQQRRSRTG